MPEERGDCYVNVSALNLTGSSVTSLYLFCQCTTFVAENCLVRERAGYYFPNESVR